MTITVFGNVTIFNLLGGYQIFEEPSAFILRVYFSFTQLIAREDLISL